MPTPLTAPPPIPETGFEEYRRAALNAGGERYTGRGTRIRRGKYAGMDQGQAEEAIREDYAKQVRTQDGGRLADEFSTPRLDAMKGGTTRWEDRANMRDVTTKGEQQAIETARNEQYKRMTAPAQAAAESAEQESPGMGADPSDISSPLTPIGPATRPDKPVAGAAKGVGGGISPIKPPGSPASAPSPVSGADTLAGDSKPIPGKAGIPKPAGVAMAGDVGSAASISPVTRPRQSWEQPGYRSTAQVTREFAQKPRKDEDAWRAEIERYHKAKNSPLKPAFASR